MKITHTEFLRGIRGTDPILNDGTPTVAFIGRSNVGKSSILNAIAGSKGLARVGKKPGKTTEINFFSINRTFYIADLPGYGYAVATPAEREKLRKLIVWYFTSDEAHPVKTVVILEARAGLTRFDEEMLKMLKEKDRPYILVLNKVDKLSQKELAAQVATIKSKIGRTEILLTSTETGRGIDALREGLFESIDSPIAGTENSL